MIKIIRRCQNSRLVEGFHPLFDESVVAPLFMPFLAYMGPFLVIFWVLEVWLSVALWPKTCPQDQLRLGNKKMQLCRKKMQYTRTFVAINHKKTRIQILYIFQTILYISEKICTFNFLAQTGIRPLIHIYPRSVFLQECAYLIQLLLLSYLCMALFRDNPVPLLVAHGPMAAINGHFGHIWLQPMSKSV